MAAASCQPPYLPASTRHYLWSKKNGGLDLLKTAVGISPFQNGRTKEPAPTNGFFLSPLEGQAGFHILCKGADMRLISLLCLFL